MGKTEVNTSWKRVLKQAQCQSRENLSAVTPTDRNVHRRGRVLKSYLLLLRRLPSPLSDVSSGVYLERNDGFGVLGIVGNIQDNYSKQLIRMRNKG